MAGNFGIFVNQNYLAEKSLSDLGITFNSDLLYGLGKLLKIKVKHASLKHIQTIGAVERSHAALELVLKLNTVKRWNDWHKYLPLATFIKKHCIIHQWGPASMFFFMALNQQSHLICVFAREQYLSRDK